jgi:hypothetical protein
MARSIGTIGIARRCSQADLILKRLERLVIGLLTLRQQPAVFLNPFFGFALRVEFAEIARRALLPFHFDAPMAELPDRRQSDRTKVVHHQSKHAPFRLTDQFRGRLDEIARNQLMHRLLCIISSRTLERTG